MSGRVVIVTGGSRGLGAGIVDSYLDSGDLVASCARSATTQTDTWTARYPDRFLFQPADLAKPADAKAFVAAVIERWGRVDVLVNNAGAGQVGTAEEISDAALQDMLAQHLRGPAAYVRAVLPHMRAAGSGAIIQMSSQGGRMSFPAVGSYSAAKFALEGWSEALAGEVAPFGVRVLIVEPSRFRTEFNASGVLKTASPDPRYAAVAGRIRADMAGADGKQEGDPARAAAVIRRMLSEPDAPLRLPLGAEAVRNLIASAQRSLDDVRRWADVSESADFPGLPPAVRGFQRTAR